MGINKIAELKSPLSYQRCILLILNYVIGYMYLYPFIGAKITLFLDPYATQILPSLQVLIYGFMILMSILIAYPLLKESFIQLKDSKTHFLRNCLVLLLELYVASMILSTIASFFSNTATSANQLDVSASVRMNPYMMMFTTLIFAPVVEEVLFRGVIFRTMRSKFSFLFSAFVSSLAFGFIHVSDSLFALQFYDVWYIIVYAGIGFFLARAYEKTNTMIGSMFLHFLNNLLAIISILGV